MTKHLLHMVFFLILSVNYLSAQTNNETPGNTKGIEVLTETDFTETIFFTDPDNQLFYIDLEALGEEVSQLVIKQNDKIVIEENITKLPTNSIFEVNLKILEKDAPYTLELTTPFGVLTKEFSIKKN